MQDIIRFFESLFTSASPEEYNINNIFFQFLILAGFILLLVAGFIIIGLIKYRAKNNQETPRQVFGNKKLEIAWTVIPLVVLILFFFLTVKSMDYINSPFNSNRTPDVVIIAHQWWWEFRYPNFKVETANELHIPVNKKLLVRVEAADVIHDWWVPDLGRKIDAVPGRTNYTWIEANRIGNYEGACSEYCGAQHAWMRISVIAESQAEFDNWIKEQQKIPNIPSDSLAVKGAKLFQEKTCANCHTISGTPAEASVGPNLTHFASRKTMLSGMMENTKQNLIKWLTNPQKVKAGARMPNFLLTKHEINILTAYLEGLK